MKKSLLVLLAIALVGSFAFAEITGVGAPTVSGSVTTTYGYDLDTEASGFYNDSSLSLILPLLDGSAVKGGSDKFYGEITVDGIGWQLNQDGFYDVDEDADAKDAAELDASISAKLVLDKIYIKLGNPGYGMNYADIPATGTYEIDANLFDADGSDDEYTNGIAVGYASDLFSLELKVSSKKDGYMDPNDDTTDSDPLDYEGFFFNDMDTDDENSYTANTENEYAFGVALTINPMEGVSIPVSFFYDGEYSSPNVVLMGFGANPTVKMGALSLAVPVDYVSADDVTGLEIGPNVTYELIPGGTNANLLFIYGSYDESLATNAVGHLVFTFTETETNGFVDNLYANLAVTLKDMMDYSDSGDDMEWAVDADFSYNLNGLKPYLNCGYGSDEVFDLGVGVILGADFTGLDNTTITLDYTNGALTDNKNGIDKAEKGRITLAAKVAF